MLEFSDICQKVPEMHFFSHYKCNKICDMHSISNEIKSFGKIEEKKIFQIEKKICRRWCGSKISCLSRDDAHSWIFCELLLKTMDIVWHRMWNLLRYFAIAFHVHSLWPPEHLWYGWFFSFSDKICFLYTYILMVCIALALLAHTMPHRKCENNTINLRVSGRSAQTHTLRDDLLYFEFSISLDCSREFGHRDRKTAHVCLEMVF